MGQLGDRVEDVLRALAPQVVGVLTRRFGDFAAAEDAVQDALLAAATQWPDQGMPDNPRGWLIQVAHRRMIAQIRGDQARRRREDLAARREPADSHVGAGADAHLDAEAGDDTLVLLLLCCHPCLTPTSAIALTLRAVGGLTTAEIAKAFLVPEATMAQRISRAKQRIKASGTPLRLPDGPDRARRIGQVLQVLYLIFTEGHTSTSGPGLRRVDLSTEAIRLTRALHAQAPGGEVAGLLALMLLTEARSPARTGPGGELIALAEQDRSRWDAAAIAEGTDLITRTLPVGPVGPYQVQAAIAALHDEAPSADATDWPQIYALYQVLERLAASPVVSLNRAVAGAMVHGPAAGLAAIAEVAGDPRLAGHHRLHAAVAHLHEMAGDAAAAITHYRAAAGLTASLPERHYLTLRAARLSASEKSTPEKFTSDKPPPR